MIIDSHTHAIPREFIDLVRKDPAKYQARVEKNTAGEEFLVHDQGYKYPLYPGFYDLETRLADMDRRKIDVDMLSPSPTIYYYWAEPELGKEINSLVNDSIARMVNEVPDRFLPIASVPLQDVDASIDELERVVDLYGFKAVTIGTVMEGKNLDDPVFLPFFKKAEELGVMVTFHPYYVGARANLEDYYLTNLIGNPLETTICISRLIFGGVLDACPDSKFVFEHGGGYIPYQRGRLQHGHSVRSESKVNIGDKALEPYFESLYYDTITHWGPALKFLIESHGSDKVVLGSDYPFDMADTDPVNSVECLDLSEEDQRNVLGGTVRRMLELE